MIYCLNPACPEPQNLSTDRQCHACGSELRLGDRYYAIQLLGQGGFERTFLAIDALSQDTIRPLLGQCVIKQFLLQLTSGQEQTIPLLQPATHCLQDLGEHPQIPKLLDAFEQDGRFYLIQAFIAGQNLATVLKQQGAFSEAQIWQLLADLLPVIQFIHQHQVIHGDIKPENIIQAGSIQTGSIQTGSIQTGQANRNSSSALKQQRLFLVDFGTAVLMASRMPTGSGIGSPEYMAPEQARGKAVYASDLYSLGITCIHLLTEVSPFDLYDHLNDRWIWRSYLSQPVSDRLAQVLDLMIQNAVNLRFQSAEAVLKASGIRMQPLPTCTPPSHPPVSTITTASAIQAIALHPIEPILASAGEDKTICLWDLTTQQRLRTLPHPSSPTRSLAFSADGTMLATAGDDKTIRLWNWRSGQLITLLKGHTGSVRSLQFRSDQLASGSWDKTIRLWQPETGETICTLKDHKLQVTAVALSPAGEWLASGSCDRTVRLWQLPVQQTGDISYTVLADHAWAVLAVAFSPDSSIVATGSEDNTVKLWEVQTGRLIQTLTGHSWAIATLAFSPDGKTLLSGSWDKTIKLWAIENGELQATLVGHTDSVNAMAIRPLPSGYQVWSGGRDRLIGQWFWQG
ncbi:MAG: protein kinase [Leptolyngbyaceae cyanobacterium CRU_2_3]|nr:protein kinase [Leptolyngbyaceae cyanobacterium CRU_2_3]